MAVLWEKAREIMVPLEVVAPLDNKKLGLKLRLSGDHQFTNASLAISLCKSWLRSTGNWERLFQNDHQDDILPVAFKRGLSSAYLPGRAQIVHDHLIRSYSPSEAKDSPSGDLTFYLDGAHSPESMEACAKWFSNAVKVNKNFSSSFSSLGFGNLEGLPRNGYVQQEVDIEPSTTSKQILLFNCMNVRDPQMLLPQLVNTCASSGIRFSKAIFVPSISSYNKVTSGASPIPLDIAAKDLSWQFNLQRIWEKTVHGKDIMFDESHVIDYSQNLPPHFIHEDVSHCNPAGRYFACSAVFPSLPSTISWLRACIREDPSLRIQVLVTGSLHLIGDVLKVLRR